MSRIASLERIVLALAVVWLVPACSYRPGVGTPRSASQQLLATESIERALDEFEFPDLRGRKVAVLVGAPGDVVDQGYLDVAVRVEMLEEEAIVVPLEEAEIVLAVLVGALSLDTSGRFLGIMGTSGGGLIPFTIPELALYKRARTEGYTRASFALVDHRTGSVIHRSESVKGETYSVSTTVFFVFTWSNTDSRR